MVSLELGHPVMIFGDSLDQGHAREAFVFGFLRLGRLQSDEAEQKATEYEIDLFRHGVDFLCVD
jgi:hypothetical protein